MENKTKLTFGKLVSGNQVSRLMSTACLLALTATAVGCGPAPTPETIPTSHTVVSQSAPTVTSQNQGQNSQNTANTYSSQQSTLSNSSATVTAQTSSATAVSLKGIPALQFKVRAVGYNSTSVTVRAGKVLRVIFVPGMQDRAVQGTGFYPQYSKLGVYIGIGTSLQATPLLDNGLRSGNLQGSQVIDLSTQIPSTCVSSDTHCRTEMTITITKPNTDYSCLNFGLYCPYQRMYPTHPWNGTVYVQTDDTDPVENVRPMQAPADGVI